MAQKVTPPRTAEELRAAIVARHDTLSKRLQQIARYVLDQPHALAIETLTVIAERAEVQPSAIVRFAQVFGFPGASQMQRLFRDDLLQANAALGYSERVRHFGELAGRKKLSRHSDVLAEFVEGSMIALRNLSETITEQQLSAAVALVDKADTVFVAGF